jgi:hypothetical protein
MYMSIKLCAAVTVVSRRHLAMDEGCWKELLSQKLTPIIIHCPHNSRYLVDDAVTLKTMGKRGREEEGGRIMVRSRGHIRLRQEGLAYENKNVLDIGLDFFIPTPSSFDFYWIKLIGPIRNHSSIRSTYLCLAVRVIGVGYNGYCQVVWIQ